MNVSFERSGPLTDIASYPRWAQDMVAQCETEKREVIEHALWDVMRSRQLNDESTRNFMIGIWPVIERFPGYMAHSLLKTQYGRSPGDDMARRWLVRNIRVEQNHAEYWLHWAEGAGIARSAVLSDELPSGTQALANWCEESSRHDTLAAGIAATNYAVEGATGEWAQILYDSQSYRDSFPQGARKSSLRWLQLHAAYDDTHPWEALEIVCTLMGNSPDAGEVAHLVQCIRRTYLCMRQLADRCVEPSVEKVLAQQAAA